jgi:hypothetical protein
VSSSPHPTRATCHTRGHVKTTNGSPSQCKREANSTSRICNVYSNLGSARIPAATSCKPKRLPKVPSFRASTRVCGVSGRARHLGRGARTSVAGSRGRLLRSGTQHHAPLGVMCPARPSQTRGDSVQGQDHPRAKGWYDRGSGVTRLRCVMTRRRPCPAAPRRLEGYAGAARTWPAG